MASSALSPRFVVALLIVLTIKGVIGYNIHFKRWHPYLARTSLFVKLPIPTTQQEWPSGSTWAASFRHQNRLLPAPTKLFTTVSTEDDVPTSERLQGYQRIPMILTYSRCAAIPLLLWTFYKGQAVATLATFLAASVTDLLDGYLARRWKVTSDFGAFLDPVVSCGGNEEAVPGHTYRFLHRLG